MSPKPKSPSPNPDQGAFFDPQPVGNGSTDPLSHEVTWQLGEAVPEGLFPADRLGKVTHNPTLYETEKKAIEEAAHTANRRRAQLAKHSPLVRDGSYMSIQLGDYLPGFGPVKERNWEDAKARARELETRRLARLAEQPVLTPDVSRTIGNVATAQTVEPASEKDLPKLKTLAERIAVIAEWDDETQFMPATRDEITTGLSVIDSYHYGKMHNHLLETFVRVKNDVKQQGYSDRVAEWHGKRAFQSRVYEEIDRFVGARAAEAALRTLSDVVDEVDNPNLTLDQVYDDRELHEGYAPLVRYLVVKHLMSGEGEIGEFDFLPMTRVDKRIHPSVSKTDPVSALSMVKERTGQYDDEALTRRNKVTFDPFSDPDMPEEVREFIIQTIQKVPVRMLRKLIPEAVYSEKNRKEFHARCLSHIGPPYKKSIAAELGTDFASYAA